ncbi:hypothetical protein Tph_c27350 [Thermacetogenium phaeum DSM 12270]|uniref:Uncharacterized protein n=1 Tax=Thermacetogenium phaeum (strain ATCC BAA-254 / DSM 26808 / PB) TaxID=1089553 RepID=K4LLR6_THEPS|nr:hypothetical protein Tph_c27350 [Thermacetogenium phaeum DSM 12270]
MKEISDGRYRKPGSLLPGFFAPQCQVESGTISRTGKDFAG